MPTTLILAIGLAVWAAIAMTFGDWLWAALSLRHRMPYGLAHGTLLCLWIGAYMGLVTKRIGFGAVAGAAIGFLAAASFYALAPLLGYSAMFLSWIGLWFGLAWLAQRLFAASASPRQALLRAVIAAFGSAAAFYAVSGIWMRPPPTPNYAWNFAAWTIAFLPGSAALLWRSSGALERKTKLRP